MLNLFDLPNREARSVLSSTGAPVFLLVNPVEYHGPHLSLHNDSLIARGVARDVHARLGRRDWPFLIAGDLEVGVDPTPGPGTRYTPFSMVREVVIDACKALHAIGARTVVAMTWHGAPLHSIAIEHGLAWMRERGACAFNPFNLAFREQCHLDGHRFAKAFDHVEDAELREEMMRGLRYDFHAGFFETSMTLHYAPESVSKSYTDVPPSPQIVPDRRFLRLAKLAHRAGKSDLEGELSMIAHGLGWHALDPFPGYTGRPHLARARSGEIFANEIADGYAKLFEEIAARRIEAPRPPMQWMATLTANGRLQPPSPRAAQ